MRMAGSILALLSGLIGIVLAFLAYQAVNSPEIQALITEGAATEGADAEAIAGIAQTAVNTIFIIGMVISAIMAIIGGLMFNGRSMALGIVAIVLGVLGLFTGAWVLLLGLIGGILHLIGRNS